MISGMPWYYHTTQARRIERGWGSSCHEGLLTAFNGEDMTNFENDACKLLEGLIRDW